jgi:hypothetical protein
VRSDNDKDKDKTTTTKDEDKTTDKINTKIRLKKVGRSVAHACEYNEIFLSLPA